VSTWFLENRASQHAGIIHLAVKRFLFLNKKKNLYIFSLAEIGMNHFHHVRVVELF
jgi:hypothetical protein